MAGDGGAGTQGVAVALAGVQGRQAAGADSRIGLAVDVQLQPIQGVAVAEEVLLQDAEALGVGFDEDLVAVAQLVAQGDAAQVVEVALQQVGGLAVEQGAVGGAARALGVAGLGQQGGARGELEAGIQAAAGQVGVGAGGVEAGVAVVEAADGQLALLPGMGQQGAGGQGAVAAAAQGGGKAGGLALEEGGGFVGGHGPRAVEQGQGRHHELGGLGPLADGLAQVGLEQLGQAGALEARHVGVGVGQQAVGGGAGGVVLDGVHGGALGRGGQAHLLVGGAQAGAAGGPVLVEQGAGAQHRAVGVAGQGFFAAV